MQNDQKRQKTILLVEDEIIIAMIIKGQLEHLGYAVHSVTSGEKAILTIHDSNNTIDLILMDIDLGTGIDGTEAAAKILESVSLPVVFLSSHIEPEIVGRTGKITSYGYVVKNTGITVLDTSIKMAFKLFDAHIKETVQREALLKSEEQYRNIFTSAIEGIFQTTPAGRFRIVNPAFARMFGYGTPEEMIESVTNIAEQLYMNPQDHAGLFKLIYSTEGRVRDFEVMLKHKDGSTFWVSINAMLVRDKENGTSFIEGTCMDITDRRHAEESLRDSELKYRSLFGNAVVGMYRSKIDGSAILEVNQALCNIFQCTIEEMLSEPALIRWADPEARREMMNRLARDGTVTGYEADFIRKNGEIMNCLVSVRLYQQEGYLEGTTIDITDRRRAADELRQERDLAQTYLEVAGVIFIALDCEGKITLINRKGCEILGLSREEILGRNWFDSFIPGYMVQDVRNVFKRIMADELEPVASFENSIINAAGAERLIAWQNTILRDRKGKITGSLSSGADITERTRMEDDLKYNRDLLNRTQHLAKIGGWEWDVLHQTMTWTDETSRIHGFEQDILPPGSPEHIDRSLNCYDPGDRKIINAAFRRCVEKGVPYDLELPFTRADGRRIWIRTMASPVMRGTSVVKVVGNIMDITEKKQSELALSESEKKYRILFEQNKDLIFIQNIEGKTITVNPQACMTLGYTYDELINIPLEKLDSPKHAVHIPERISSLVRNGYASFETELVTRDGVIIPVDAHAVKIEWDGKPAIFSIGRDITVRKSAEERINALLMDKEMILKEVHHRIKNNMNTIKSLLLMQSDSIKNREATDALKEASARVQSMAVLYDRLYRSENLGEMALRDYLEPLVEEVVSLFPLSAAIKVINRYDDFNLPANTLVTIGIIVNELITNAIKYAFAGRETGILYVSAVKTGNNITLSVEDDGIGMPAGFDADTSTGFGLILVKSLCGHIDAKFSISGHEGTRVAVEFKA